MREDELEPMDADLRALLRKGAAPIAAPSGAAERVLARLGATTLAVAAVTTAGASTAGASVASTTGAATASGSAIAAGVAKTSLLVPVLLALAVGGAGGAALTRALAPEKERVVYVDRPVPIPASPPSISTPPALRVEDLPLAPVAPSATAASPRRDPSQAAIPSAASAEAASDLAVRERRMVDGARLAFARGAYDEALETLAAHAQQYPRGQLAEEREALAVRALASLGKKDDARARAAKFRAKYPTSLMLPAVQAAVE